MRLEILLFNAPYMAFSQSEALSSVLISYDIFYKSVFIYYLINRLSFTIILHHVPVYC